MKAMILAAGRGQRLAPLTDRTPKPLLEIGAEPLICHQLRWLRDAGITEVVVNLHHLGEQIEATLGAGERFGVAIHYSREPELLETGGGIKRALPLLGSKAFVVLNGDIWTDFSFSELPTELGDDLAHLLLIDKPIHRDAGDFDLLGDRVSRGAMQSMVYCGVSVLSPRLFETTSEAAFSLRDLLFEAARLSQLGGQQFNGQWIDIGSPDQLSAARQMASENSRR